MSNEQKTPITVGMKLYREVGSHRKGTGIAEDTVKSIGRKYITLENSEKVEIETLQSKGFYGLVQYYTDRAVIENEQELRNLFYSVQKSLDGYTHNNRFTLQQLRGVATILNLPGYEAKEEPGFQDFTGEVEDELQARGETFFNDQN